MIAEEQRDFSTAEKWYLKSLEIKEKQGNEHGAGSTYHQLGMIAEETQDFPTAGQRYCSSAKTYTRFDSTQNYQIVARSVRRLFEKADAGQQEELVKLWNENGLGEFPEAFDDKESNE